MDIIVTTSKAVSIKLEASHILEQHKLVQNELCKRSKSGLRSVIDNFNIMWVEQNPKKNSRTAGLLKQGYKITWGILNPSWVCVEEAPDGSVIIRYNGKEQRF